MSLARPQIIFTRGEDSVFTEVTISSPWDFRVRWWFFSLANLDRNTFKFNIDLEEICYSFRSTGSTTFWIKGLLWLAKVDWELFNDGKGLRDNSSDLGSSTSTKLLSLFEGRKERARGGVGVETWVGLRVSSMFEKNSEPFLLMFSIPFLSFFSPSVIYLHLSFVINKETMSSIDYPSTSKVVILGHSRHNPLCVPS